jgi:nitroimidazol reductase NimA-like FMN-containing flavoprotein (pyridoxamine 5'-phosphate oxidase superfamily)
MTLEKMQQLAREKDICVLATASGGTPHCSLMAYVIDDGCREIYMATFKKTTKFKNLTENPDVSLLIDTREEHAGPLRSEAKAMTVDGTFQKIDDESKKHRMRVKLLERHPHLKDFLAHPDAEVFCIKIRSFLLLDGLTEAHFEEIL